jgi:glycosyltransferase involved in cell wall biosynthesis
MPPRGPSAGIDNLVGSRTAGSAGPAPVVVLSNCPWHSQWRRRQQIASRLAARREVYFLDPPFSALDLARGRVPLGRWLVAPLQIETDPTGVHIVRGTAGIPAQRFCGPIGQVNGWLQRAWARRCLEALRHRENLAPPILICYEPLLHPLATLGPARATIYDAADDYAALSRSSYLRRILRRRMDALAGSSDLTIAASVALQARLAPVARRAELLPHGVDVRRFHPDAHVGSRFEAVSRESGLRAVFHGTLDHRLDQDVLAQLLRAGVTLLLAGECAWSGAQIDRLRRAGDVRFFGLLDQDEVASLVAAAQVGIIPYRPLPGMECIQTLKRLEFYACGLPVVATEIRANRAWADELTLAGDPTAFADAVRAVASAPAEQRRRWRTMAEAHTWDAVVAQFEAWLAELEQTGR